MIQKDKMATVNSTPNCINNIGRFVFICGLHRSGTTLVEQVLSKNYQVNFLRTGHKQNEGQHVQSVYSTAQKFGGPGKFALNENEQHELHKLSNYSEIFNRIITDWSKFIEGNSDILVEKSPPNLTKIWWLRNVFQNSKFVVIVRDPIVVSLATQKWSNNSIEELLEHYHLAYSNAVKHSFNHDTIIVKYEDLCAAPKSYFEQISSFCNLTKRQNRIYGLEIIQNTNPQYLNNFKNNGKSLDGIWQRFGYHVEI